MLAERWGDEADQLARQRAEEIRTALSGHTAQSLPGPSDGGAGKPVPGGPYLEYRRGPDEFRASAEVRSGLESRCIRVRLGADAVVHTEIEGGDC